MLPHQPGHRNGQTGRRRDRALVLRAVPADESRRCGRVVAAGQVSGTEGVFGDVQIGGTNSASSRHCLSKPVKSATNGACRTRTHPRTIELRTAGSGRGRGLFGGLVPETAPPGGFAGRPPQLA